MERIIKVEHLDMDPMKMTTFKEYLNYILRQKKPLSFIEFQRNCGISRTQWDLFKMENVENETIQWHID